MNKYSDLVALSNKELIREFEYRVKFDHYDPMGMKEPRFKKEDLINELLERMSKYGYGR